MDKVKKIIPTAIFSVIILLIIIFMIVFKMFIVVSAEGETPGVNVGNLVLVNTKVNNYSVGDKVTYYDSDLKVPVVQKITNADKTNNTYEVEVKFSDELTETVSLKSKDIQGKVIFSSLALGTFFLKYEIMFIILPIVIVAGCIALFFIKGKDKNKDNKNKDEISVIE